MKRTEVSLSVFPSRVFGKKTKPGIFFSSYQNSSSSIVGPNEPDLKNCPIRALKIYRKRSHGLRDPKQRALFLSCNSIYKNDIRLSIISRWMRTLIIDAYLYWADGGGGESVSGVLALPRPRTHEIRAWAASLTSKSVPLPHVLKSVFWSGKMFL